MTQTPEAIEPELVPDAKFIGEAKLFTQNGNAWVEYRLRGETEYTAVDIPDHMMPMLQMAASQAGINLEDSEE